MAETDKLFTKAEEAINKKNYEYAIDLLQQVLSIKPDDVKARQTLRGVCLRQAKEKGTPSPAMAYLKGLGPLLGMALAFKNHEKKIAAAQRFLVIAPENVPVRLALGDALYTSGHLDGAIAEVEAVYNTNARNIRAARTLGMLYREKKDTKKALACYEAVKQLVPTDREASQAIKDLTAEGTIQGGWEGAEGSRDMMKDQDKAKQLAEDQKIHKTTEEIDQEIATFQEQINAAPDDPKSTKLYQKLGEAYVKKGDLESATAAYEKAAQLDPADGRIRVKLGDITIKGYTLRINELVPTAKGGDAGAKEQIKQLKAELLAFQIEEFQRRIKDHPTDMALKYELGRFLFDGGQIDAAMNEFQQTIKDPKRKLDSHEYMGRCFMQKKLYDMSIAQFKKAIENNNSTEREKPLRYYLGTTLETKGDKAAALEEYKKIYEIDIKFKDVGQRIERLQAEMGG